jgi:hypothetical protein
MLFSRLGGNKARLSRNRRSGPLSCWRGLRADKPESALRSSHNHFTHAAPLVANRSDSGCAVLLWDRDRKADEKTV